MTRLPGRSGAAPLTAALAVLAIGLAGCGGSAESVSRGAEPGPAGTLAIAVPHGPRNLDPLLARTRSDLLVTRQIYEPLVQALTGPYGDMRHAPGLAIALDPLAHDTIWRVRLRQDVRFQDGALFNASAVLDNAQRWRTTPEGRALLPDLVAVDAPRPDLVRFLFSSPNPRLQRQLASPRLGIVSPRVLRSLQGTIRLVRGARTGTGPFELRRRGAARIAFARNVRWWGTRHGLGPAVDQVALRVVPSAAQRLALLRRGGVEVAEDLGNAQLDRLRRDPLLTYLPGKRATALGLVRSVRGIGSAGAIPPLSEVWLTRIGAGTG